MLREVCPTCGKTGIRESFHGEGEWFLQPECKAHAEHTRGILTCDHKIGGGLACQQPEGHDGLHDIRGILCD